MLRALVITILAGTAAVVASASVPAAASAAPASTPASAALVLPADVDDFTFQSLDVDYTLSRADDGTSRLRVVETFVAAFPDIDQNHGMRRLIPDTYNGQPLFPRLESITDENGRPRESESDSDDGVFSMTSRAGGFVHGTQTYVFTYTLQNVTWAFADTGDDEFYWDINGVDWSQSFGRVTATLHLDPALASSLTGQQACYQGAQGSTDTCDIAFVPNTDGTAAVRAEAQNLAPFETMTIAVGFAKGTFRLFDSSYLASPWGWAQGAAGAGVLGAVAFAGVQRGRRLRDAPGRGVIIPEYTPPARIDALQSAVLLGKPAKAVPAEVLEQAVVGSIRIVEGGRRMFGGVRLQAELVDPSRADGDGRMLLRGLFGDDPAPGAIFPFGRSDTRFSAAAQKMLSWANKALVTGGLRRRVGWVPRGVPLLLVIVAAVLVGIFGFAAMNAGVAAWAPILVMVAAIGAVFLVGSLVARKPLTAAGVETRDHLLGLKMFIEWAEADRIRMLQSPTGAERVPVNVNDPRQMLRLYETLLPYAVVFGQEKEWAQRIIVLYGTSTPYWYVGSSGFNASSFSAGISSLSASAASSSSTSGGSGGGGSAGGGGGGGGGGGV